MEQPAPTRPAARRWRRLLVTRAAAYWLLGLGIILCALALGVFFSMIRMPGQSYRGPLPPLTSGESALADELRRDVVKLAEEIGPRHVWNPDRLALAAEFIERSLQSAGYEVARQTFMAEGVECCNLEVQRRGGRSSGEIVIIGAHYDSVYEDGCPGANDNASGVAATLALARRFADREPDRTVRFVLFANEEPPFFQTDRMGPRVKLRALRRLRIFSREGH